MTVACRVCGKPTTKRGFLYVCQASKCSAAHWDKRAVLKNNLEDDAVLERVLSDASVPEYLQGQCQIKTAFDAFLPLPYFL